MMPRSGRRVGYMYVGSPIKHGYVYTYLKTRSESQAPSPRPFSSVLSRPASAQEPVSQILTAQPLHDHRSNLFDSNIQPIRAILRSENDSDNSKLGIFPWRPWRATKTAAVGEATPKSPKSPITTMNTDGPIAEILRFPPLLDAFGGFCRKALCSEVGGLSRVKSGRWLYPKTHGVLCNRAFIAMHCKRRFASPLSEVEVMLSTNQCARMEFYVKGSRPHRFWIEPALQQRFE